MEHPVLCEFCQSETAPLFGVDWQMCVDVPVRQSRSRISASDIVSAAMVNREQLQACHISSVGQRSGGRGCGGKSFGREGGGGRSNGGCHRHLAHGRDNHSQSSGSTMMNRVDVSDPARIFA